MSALVSGAVDVVTFGEILWDIYEAEPRRAGESIARLLRSELGGAPANVAIGLARLGVRAGVCGGLGRDAFGESMATALAAEGLDTSLLIHRAERTGLTFVRRDARGEPSFLFYRQRTADVTVQARDLPASLGGAKWLLVGTSTWMTPCLRNTTRALLRQARREKVAVVVDLNVRAHLWPDRELMKSRIAELAARADLLKASDADLATLSRDELGWLKAHAPQATWMITRGGGTSTAIGPFGKVERAAETREVVDATGAGDAFLAGVLATLVATDARPGRPSWQDARVLGAAMENGHAMGARAVSAAGAVSGLTDLDALVARLRELRAKTGTTS